MKQYELEHIIRAAGAITDSKEMTTPPGTFVFNYTDYSINSSGVSGSKTRNLVRQTDGSFTLQESFTFSGRVVVKSATLTVASPDNVNYSVSNSFDLAPGQSLTISNDKIITDIKGLPNIPDKLVFAYNTENLTFEYSSIASEGQIRKTGSSYSYNYYLKDHLGSTRMVINDDGEIVQALMYQPYGTTTNVPGMVSGSTDPLREKFTGKELDEDGKDNGAPGIGQIYFGVRFYDPDLGIFMSTDPAEEFYYAYSYCSGDPINLVDPDGRNVDAKSSGGTDSWLYRASVEAGGNLFLAVLLEKMVNNPHTMYPDWVFGMLLGFSYANYTPGYTLSNDLYNYSIKKYNDTDEKKYIFLGVFADIWRNNTYETWDDWNEGVTSPYIACGMKRVGGKPLPKNFHGGKGIKETILKQAGHPDYLRETGKGHYSKVVGDNPDVDIKNGKIILKGTLSGFKGKTYETGLESSLFFDD